MGALPFHLSDATLGFGDYSGNPGAVHQHIQFRNVLFGNDRKDQLLCASYIFQFALGDGVSNSLRGSLYGFGRYVQAGEKLERFTSATKRRVTAHDSFHPPDVGRGFKNGNAKIAVNRMLPFGAMGAEIVGPPNLDRTDNGEKGFGAHFLEACLVATRTRDGQVMGIRWIELQQLSQCPSPGMMHRGPDRCLVTFQIEIASRFSVAKNSANQLCYFAGDFSLDRLRRFFSWAVCSVCSIGRTRQIFRLTSTRLSVRSLNLRYSATSLSAFRIAAGEGRFWVTVLPSIFWVSW
jgi:hypothetical protein